MVMGWNWILQVDRLATGFHHSFAMVKSLFQKYFLPLASLTCLLPYCDRRRSGLTCVPVRRSGWFQFKHLHLELGMPELGATSLVHGSLCTLYGIDNRDTRPIDRNRVQTAASDEYIAVIKVHLSVVASHASDKHSIEQRRNNV